MHPILGMGGGARGVILHPMHSSRSTGMLNFQSRRGFREVERHERRKCGPHRQSSQDALTIGISQSQGGYRRLKVGHDNGPSNTLHGIVWIGLYSCAVALIQMPVIGAR